MNKLSLWLCLFPISIIAKFHCKCIFQYLYLFIKMQMIKMLVNISLLRRNLVNFVLKWFILSINRAFLFDTSEKSLAYFTARVSQTEFQSLNSGNLKLLGLLSSYKIQPGKFNLHKQIVLWIFTSIYLSILLNGRNFQSSFQTLPDTYSVLSVCLSLKIHPLAKNVIVSIYLCKNIKILKLYPSKILFLWKSFISQFLEDCKAVLVQFNDRKNTKRI